MGSTVAPAVCGPKSSGVKPRTIALLAIPVGTFMVTFDGAAVQIALPVLQRDLGTTVGNVQWTMTGYLLVSTVLLLPAGRAGDTAGRERVWHWGVGVFALASVLATVAPGLWWLVGARAVQGIGAALATANAAAILADAWGNRRSLALGIGNLAIAFGLVAGPPLGALLTHLGTWRLLFPPAALFGGLAFFGARHRLPESTRSLHHHRDVLGALLSILGLSGVVIGGAHAYRWGWASIPTLVSLGGGLLLLALFLIQEARAPEPLLRLSLFRQRYFLSGSLTVIFGYFALFAVTGSMPYFLITGQGHSVVGAGLMAGMVPLGLSITAPIAGYVADSIGARGLATSGQAVVCLAMLLIVVGGQHAGTTLLLIALWLIGAGMGCFEAPNLAATLGGLADEEMGVGSATLSVLRNLGMTLGTAMAETLIDAVMSDTGTASRLAIKGAEEALLVGALAAALGAVASAIRPRGR